MIFVLVGRVQAEYPLAKGLFLPKAVYFSSSFFKQTFTKRNIGEPVPLLKSHPYFLSPDVNEFL